MKGLNPVARGGLVGIGWSLMISSELLLDNKVLDALQKKFAKIKTPKGQQSFLARHPALYSYIVYYLMMSGMAVGGDAAIKAVIESYNPPKKEIVKEKQPTRGKLYKINSDADFAKLFDDAMPLVALSMFPTETLNLNVYSDNGKKINTVGMGSYYWPKNGDENSSNWERVASHKGIFKNFSIGGNRAYRAIAAWAKKRENGRVYKNMRKLLIGTELSLNEFVAIFSCTYNNELLGRKLCNFVKKNYKDPIKCASFLADLPTNGFSGLIDRHCHEALVYLNLDDYIGDIPEIKSANGATSVTALKSNDFDKMRDDLRNGKLGGARQIITKIKNARVPGGKKIYDIIKESFGPQTTQNILNSPNLLSKTFFLTPENAKNFKDGTKKLAAENTKKITNKKQSRFAKLFGR
jgi:hypothetical protein